ncbi:transposase [Streptomyces sp. Root369]|uniref:transposase n=1 Tax=Streptomyces sp. Root369 TaxID=1736523 RepID=UPI000AA2529F|nr:transposase [Streptomyces sp. Root369]
MGRGKQPHDGLVNVVGEAAVLRAKLWQYLREQADAGQLKAIEDGRAAGVPWHHFGEAMCMTSKQGACQKAHAEWLTVFQLPTYAPDLNPQEGIWSLVKRDIGNLAAADLSQATRPVKRKLKTPQYRPKAIDGCLAGTGLAPNV